MNGRGTIVLASLFLVGACAGGGGGSPSPNGAALPPLVPTYATVPMFGQSSSLEGPATFITIDRNAKTLAELPGGAVVGQVTGSASGIATLSLTVTGIAAGPISETFQAADLATSTLITGPPDRTLLSGTKTATDGSVWTLTVLDTGSAGFNYMVLGSWEYASVSTPTSAVGSTLVIGAATRSPDIPLTGTATYSGVMFGRYADGNTVSSVTAQAGATANFANREVALSTTGTLVGITPRSDLNLSGTLTYPTATTNNLTGTLSTASGLSGPGAAQFYGFYAAEIGGTFFVKDAGNTQQMTGSFGLKR
jgi:hypothetical protein